MIKSSRYVFLNSNIFEFIFHCTVQSIKYLMKVDDDSYINLRRLSEYVTIIDKRCSQKCIVGHVLGPNSPVIRPKFVQGEVHEEFVGKWVVPSYIYSQETFPNAVSGSGYIISQDMISCIFKSVILAHTANILNVQTEPR